VAGHFDACQQIVVADGAVTRFRWERALIMRGPPSPTTRLLLLVLGTHINREGLAWPSQSTLAEETGLSERVIPEHLETAEQLGWIERTSSRDQGKAWRRHTYRIRIPSLAVSLGTAPRSAPPQTQGMERRSAASTQGAEPGADGAESGALGTEPGRSLVQNDVHINNEVITSLNTPKGNTTNAKALLNELEDEHAKVNGNGNVKGVYRKAPVSDEDSAANYERNRRIAELILAGRNDEARALRDRKP